MGYRMAVVGATGMVGREILKTVSERGLPVSAMVALSAGRGGGQQVSFGDEQVLTVRALDGFDFMGTQLAFFAAGSAAAQLHAPRAAEAGCTVIETSGAFGMAHDVPMVVPEVNPQALGRMRRRIVAIPHPATIPLLLALQPLHALAKARRAVVSTYESVSALGREAMDELWSQTRAIYVNEAPPAEQFTKQIAFNCIPHVGDFQGDGATGAEAALAAETRKVLSPDIAVLATCVRVPAFIGHAAAVHVAFEEPITEAAARAALREAPGIIVLDRREDGGYATQAEIAGEDAVFVSRLRHDPTVPHGLAFWCVTDNLRKGSALNAVQVAEEMLARRLLGA
ncbi:aspartate-semialdehyde dehydrogenase [Falsiroseomonas selenitidurans]|uniref:Aspartate-semialdehyde dehydrogenase n=1 Tax=Falsiroseomonas selenitidurans TaxID=2716335 RepID=A0ABX1E7A2_9PROT|nr:aspartate-semialdehyde dehydrogenase [Falsiroseomonas selenitidurans]NKC32595.1 aspartate-semialdehyde dehydrogenase [Falsiroseomonas selenitidurans]